MITNGNSNYSSRFGWTHKVIGEGDEENELKQKRPEEEQVSSKRMKLDEDKRYLPLEVVSEMLDEAYNKAIKLNEFRQTSTVAMEIIESRSDEHMDVIRTEEEEADRLRFLALVYRNKGKYAKALAEWDKLTKLPQGSTAFNEMGELYSSDCQGIEKNIPLALEYFKKGARKKDLYATFNAAMTYDKMRFEAIELKEKNEYRQKASRYYDKVAKIKRPSDLKVAEARFNTLYLSHLDKNGAFAPEDLYGAKTAYEKLARKHPDDGRIPLMRASVEYYINKDKERTSFNTIYRWLEASAEKGNSISKELLEHKDKLSFAREFEAYLKDPQAAYMQHSQYGTHILY